MGSRSKKKVERRRPVVAVPAGDVERVLLLSDIFEGRPPERDPVEVLAYLREVSTEEAATDKQNVIALGVLMRVGTQLQELGFAGIIGVLCGWRPDRTMRAMEAAKARLAIRPPP